MFWFYSQKLATVLKTGNEKSLNVIKLDFFESSQHDCKYIISIHADIHHYYITSC